MVVTPSVTITIHHSHIPVARQQCGRWLRRLLLSVAVVDGKCHRHRSVARPRGSRGSSSSFTMEVNTGQNNSKCSSATLVRNNSTCSSATLVQNNSTCSSATPVQNDSEWSSTISVQNDSTWSTTSGGRLVDASGQ